MGVLSDSHGEAARTRSAVEELARRGATLFIHCGDIETMDCLDPLAGLDSHVVFGNVDEPADLTDYAHSIGIKVHQSAGEVVVDGQRLAFAHGDQPGCMERILRTKPAWFFHGHTHQMRDVRVGPVRVVNPGALCRASQYSVALVVPALGTVEFVVVA